MTASSEQRTQLHGRWRHFAFMTGDYVLCAQMQHATFAVNMNTRAQVSRIWTPDSTVHAIATLVAQHTFASHA